MGKIHKKNPSHFTHIQFQKNNSYEIPQGSFTGVFAAKKYSALSWMFMTNFMQLLQQSVSYINRHEIPW